MFIRLESTFEKELILVCNTENKQYLNYKGRDKN
jgi:hypothetical protein